MIKLNFNKDRFGEFVSRIKDLNNIDDNIRFKITPEYIYMYSTLGTNIMLGFKNHLLRTDDFFDDFNIGDGTEIDMILSNCSKLVKNLEFIQTSDKITMSFKEEIESENIYTTRMIEIKGGKLKIKWHTSELYLLRDISKAFLDQGLNLDNKDWSFTLTNDQFEDIVKLSRINSNNIITFEVNNGTIKAFEQGAWELELNEIEKRSASFTFNKRFFRCIDMTGDEMTFHLFESFILIKNEVTNLMLSYEQDFSDDDL